MRVSWTTTNRSWPLLLLAFLLLSVIVDGASDSGSASADDVSATTSTSSSLTLNTLTTSCNGGCSTNSACVVVGQSSANPINCVNDTRCATLLNGRAALCMDAFDASDSDWIFQPAKTNDSAGVAPFERVGLLQLDDQVTEVDFHVAAVELQPLSSALDISSLNIQPEVILTRVSFTSLSLTGAEDALPLSSVLQVSINNCNLTTIPTQLVSGSDVTHLDLTNNLISSIPSDFQSQSFPTLQVLTLSNNSLTSFSLEADMFPNLTSVLLLNNNLQEFPSVVFDLPALQDLMLDNNPFNASDLSAEEFTFLAGLRYFSVNGTTSTTACPDADVIAKLNESFTFCIEDNATIVVPSETPPATIVVDSPDDSSDRTWVIVGVVISVVVMILLLLLLYRRNKHRYDSPKLMNGTAPSIAVGMGDMADHPYLEMHLQSHSSHTTSDFELLASVADGYIGLTRLSYDDVYLHKMLRVSSRSELWVGEYKDEQVLIKKIKSNTASKALLRDFVTEIELMFELKHPRIAEFKGAMWDAEGTELCAVVEYAERGALRDCTTKGIELTVPKQHAIARQLVDALAFLHHKSIVHGRLNSFNVLLDKDYSAKLSVFSIFHYVKLSPLDQECRIFVAPEVLRGEQPSEKADVYALAVVLVELDTGEMPVMNAKRLAMERLSEGMLSPTTRKTGFRLSRHCSALLKEVIAACLDRDPRKRPTMNDIAFALQTGAMRL